VVPRIFVRPFPLEKARPCYGDLGHANGAFLLWFALGELPNIASWLRFQRCLTVG
jgi:hypothetical protein